MSIYIQAEHNGEIADRVRQAVMALRPVSAAVQLKSLAAPAVSMAGGQWFTTGVAKRQIIDLRGEKST